MHNPCGGAPHKESISQQTRPSRLHNTRLLIQAPFALPCLPPIPPLFPPDHMRVTHAHPFNPAAWAFVPFGIVLVRFRVRELSSLTFLIWPQSILLSSAYPKSSQVKCLIPISQRATRAVRAKTLRVLVVFYDAAPPVFRLPDGLIYVSFHLILSMFVCLFVCFFCVCTP